MVKSSIERSVAHNNSTHPNLLASLEFLVIIPLVLLPFYGAGYGVPAIVPISLFLCYGLLSWRVGAGTRLLPGRRGKVFERSLEFLLLVSLSLYALDYLSSIVVLAKILVEGSLLIACMRKRESGRSGINFVALLVLLLFVVELRPGFITPELVNAVFALSAVVSAVMLGRILGLLHKRLIADALSAGNLLCGVFSVYMATLGRIDLSLLFIGLGAVFDGLDGAAARRFGATRWGVYSDDVADAVTYGIAPGMIVALQLGLPSLDAVLIGSAYALFTIGRLLYFTLNKANADPDYFAGAPSVLAGILVVSAVYLFAPHAALIGMFAGAACVLMVTFDTRYRHLGRFIASRRAVRWVSLAAALLLLLFGFLGWSRLAVGLLFAGCLVYGFLPMVQKFVKLVGSVRR